MSATVIEVSAAALRAEPGRYDGLRVRFRDIVHSHFEGMSAAGAWWTSTGGDIDGEGTYLADVEGLWSSSGDRDGRGHGHMGMWPAEIRGEAWKVSFDAPRAIEESALEAAEERVPLEVSLTVNALLQGHFWRGLELWRLGDDGRLPAVERPYQQEARAVLCRDGRRLYLDRFQLSGAPRPIVPTRLEPAALASAPGGAFIEVTGQLEAGARRAFSPRPGWPELVSWPRLEGCLDVVVPEIALTYHRYAVPNVDSPGMPRWIAALSNGPRRVRAVGEIRISLGDPGDAPRAYLWATELELA